jgi:hypothetical protein
LTYNTNFLERWGTTITIVGVVLAFSWFGLLIMNESFSDSAAKYINDRFPSGENEYSMNRFLSLQGIVFLYFWPVITIIALSANIQRFNKKEVLHTILLFPTITTTLIFIGSSVLYSFMWLVHSDVKLKDFRFDHLFLVLASIFGMICLCYLIGKYTKRKD